ncbi:hypothetical protein Zmor_019811 [Zophobas morio]|uniref:Uncharacterized protein n=2 Tax=Zophobas morio TaxID=2755281 RepID=A0AA38I2T4_9CUCU|nr:hypothetical protein Zmor_019811 [Zophobas morio]
MNKLTLVTLLFFGSCFCADEDYYWREYFGAVPADAFVAGKTLDGKNVYIGQAYLKDAGIIVAQISPGEKEVSVPYNGIHKVNKYIKILCGPQVKFYWMKANATDLHVQVTDKHAVLGGHEDKNGYMNIGRISLSGDVKIGKVNSFWVENAYFYYNENGKEKKLRSYEILMYNGEIPDVDVRITSE